MKFIDLFFESISVLKGNKLRTFLSILGIVIGISSVIVLINLGKASQQTTLSRISALGSDVINIRPGSSGGNQFFGVFRGGGGGSNNIKTLKESDALAIITDKRISNINLVAYEYSSNNNIIFEKNSANVSVTGISQNYFVVRNIKVSLGSNFEEADFQSNSKNIVIGPTTAQTLFGNENPLGKGIRIGSSTYTVIGITESKGSTGPQNLDDVVYIPLGTAQNILYGVNHLSAIYVKVNDTSKILDTQNQLGFLVLEKHNLKNVSDADFNITSASNLVQTITEVTSTFTSLLSGIAAISLIVGGIGIMNIMIVTVNERTREIGIRKAIGAKRKEITLQFLLEAVILTGVGGIIGILAGVGISIILTSFLNLNYVFSIEPVALAFFVSTVIGVIFGWYPANVASKLQPIEALRYE